jgi:hypothetical protein
MKTTRLPSGDNARRIPPLRTRRRHAPLATAVRPIFSLEISGVLSLVSETPLGITATRRVDLD